MKIGVTGTRNGMNKFQKEKVTEILKHYTITREVHEFHHGDCVGVDTEAANIAYSLAYRIVCHPPVLTELRAFNKNYSEIRNEKTYFARNRDIVDSTALLIVVPKETRKQSSGGTWYTHGYAVKKGKRICIVYPDRVEYNEAS